MSSAAIRKSVNEANENAMKTQFLVEYERSGHLQTARAMSGATNLRVMRWCREDPDFQEKMRVVHDRVAGELYRAHRDAAADEGKLSRFYENERRAHEPEYYSEHGMRIRAEEALAGDAEADFDAVGA